jgi:hypothetical protein
MNQKASLIFEREETVVLRQSESHRRSTCDRCGEGLFITPEILAGITGSSEREIFRLVEAGAITFVETSRLYVCPDCYQRALGVDERVRHEFGVAGELK